MRACKLHVLCLIKLQDVIYCKLCRILIFVDGDTAMCGLGGAISDGMSSNDFFQGKGFASISNLTSMMLYLLILWLTLKTVVAQ